MIAVETPKNYICVIIVLNEYGIHELPYRKQNGTVF
jgi:hypothetical protein